MLFFSFNVTLYEEPKDLFTVLFKIDCINVFASSIFSSAE